MECNEGKRNIYKIILIKSLKINDHQNTSEHWTEGPQLDKHLNHDYKYFSTEHGNMKNWNHWIIYFGCYFPSNLLIRIGS